MADENPSNFYTSSEIISLNDRCFSDVSRALKTPCFYSGCVGFKFGTVNSLRLELRTMVNFILAAFASREEEL